MHSIVTGDIKSPLKISFRVKYQAVSRGKGYKHYANAPQCSLKESTGYMCSVQAALTELAAFNKIIRLCKSFDLVGCGATP